MLKGRTNRRDFIRAGIFGILALPFAGIFRSAFAGKNEAPLPAGAVPVPATDPVALAIGYKPDVKDIDTTKYPQRKKPEAKNQFCKACALYTSVNESWGKCQLMTSGLVRSTGWCGSWSKKS